MKERFLGFTDCPQLDASALAKRIVNEVMKLGLNIKECVAQCNVFKVRFEKRSVAGVSTFTAMPTT